MKSLFFEGTLSPDNESHVYLYQIKLVLCDGLLIVFKFVNIVVPEMLGMNI
jgi:hypothetical protein